MVRGRVGKRLIGDHSTAKIIGRIEYDQPRGRFMVVRFNEGQDASALRVDDIVEFYPRWEGPTVRIFSGTITNIEKDRPSGQLIYSYVKSRF